MVKNYQDLKFWKTSFDTTKQILNFIKKLPKDTSTKILISQLIRSASSIGANIAEGSGRYKGKEYQRFLRIALGSANETEYWLLLLKETHPKKLNEIEKIMELNNQTIRMLVTTLKTLQKKTIH